MNPAALIAAARADAEACMDAWGDLDDSTSAPCGYGVLVNLRTEDGQKVGNLDDDGHLDAHLDAAIRAWGERVVREAFEAGAEWCEWDSAAGQPEGEPPPDEDAVVARLAEGGGE